MFFRRLQGHTPRGNHKQNWGRGFIFLLPQVAALPESDAGSDDIEQALVFTFETVRFCVTCCARCMEHAVKTLSLVCLGAPHKPFGEGARPHCTSR